MAYSVSTAQDMQNILKAQKRVLESCRNDMSSQAGSQDLDQPYAGHMRSLAGTIGSIISSFDSRIAELELIIHPPQPPSGGGGNPGP